jgi:hypothetical protein
MWRLLVSAIRAAERRSEVAGNIPELGGCLQRRRLSRVATVTGLPDLWVGGLPGQSR